VAGDRDPAGSLSGWYGLRSRFPDRPQAAVFKLNHLYGSMGGVHLKGVLVLGVCPDGLRIGVWRVFMPFAGNIFVPWSQLHVTRRNRILWKTAVFDFGGRGAKLKIADHMANRLARAAGGHWPERGVFPPETAAQAGLRVGGQWLAATLLAGTFFTVVSRSVGADTALPIWLAFGFPATVYGVYSLFQFATSVGR
jgi:hypothetical protein